MNDQVKYQIDEALRGGMKYSEIAEYLDIPIATVRSYCNKKEAKPKQPKQAPPEGKPDTSSTAGNEKTYVDYLAELSGKIAAGSAVETVRLLSAKEASKILGVNANTVYNLWNSGLLDYWRIHRTMKTNVQAITEFLNRTKNKDLTEVNEA